MRLALTVGVSIAPLSIALTLAVGLTATFVPEVSAGRPGKLKRAANAVKERAAFAKLRLTSKAARKVYAAEKIGLNAEAAANYEAAMSAAQKTERPGKRLAAMLFTEVSTPSRRPSGKAGAMSFLGAAVITGNAKLAGAAMIAGYGINRLASGAKFRAEARGNTIRLLNRVNAQPARAEHIVSERGRENQATPNVVTVESAARAWKGLRSKPQGKTH